MKHVRVKDMLQIAQILWQMIGLIKLHKPAKFHQYTICAFLLADL